MSEILPPVSEAQPESRSKIEFPLEEGSAAETVRGNVEEALSEESQFDLELLGQISDAYDLLKKTLARKRIGADEIGKIQKAMELMGSYENALEAFGTEGLRRYFQLLSGTDTDHPFYLTLPIQDEDLNAYWDYDHYHDDPSYQDDIVLEYIDEQVEMVAVDLLISRLKANPEFYKKVVDDEQAKDAAGKSHITAFTKVVFDAYRESVAAKSKHPSAKTADSDFPFKKSSFALSYYFYSKDRIKKMGQYFGLLQSGKVIAAAKVKREIRKEDCRYLEKLEHL
jgi:hypothetical protein